MDTAAPDRAFQDAREDVSRLGPQRKSDLAGSQGDDRVQFFQWPLVDGKSWSTRWDHQPVTITATFGNNFQQYFSSPLVVSTSSPDAGTAPAPAIYLVLELGQPFAGLMQISSAPLRNALTPLSP